MAKKVAKKKPVKKTNARAKSYDKPFAINGSLEDVLRASLVSAKKQTKK